MRHRFSQSFVLSDPQEGKALGNGCEATEGLESGAGADQY